MITNRANENTFYNFEDLNRVESKTREVANLLTRYGYPVTISCKTDWEMTDLPEVTEMERYIGNIKKCVTQYNSVPDVSLPISIDGLDYVGANNIEKTLVGIERLLDKMIAAFKECGTFYCGEE